MRQGRAWLYVGCWLLVLLGSLSPGVAQGTYALPTERQPMTAQNADKIAELAVLTGLSCGSISITLNPDGNLLACGGSKDHDVHLVEVATGTEKGRLQGHTTLVRQVAFSPDGSLLASTGVSFYGDRTIRLWEVKTHSQRAMLQTSGVDELVFSPDGRLLAYAGGRKPGQVTLWEVQSATAQKVFENISAGISWSMDGKLLAGGREDGWVHVWDIIDGKENLRLKGHTGPVKATAFSPDGTMLASGGDDRTIRLWEVASGRELRSMPGHPDAIATLAFSRESKILASIGSGVMVEEQGKRVFIGVGFGDKSVRLWEPETGQPIALLNIGKGVSAVALNLDWPLIVAGDADGTIRLWGRRPSP